MSGQMTDLDCGETDVEWGGKPARDWRVAERLFPWVAIGVVGLVITMMVVTAWSSWPAMQAKRVEGMNRIHEAHATATALWRE